MAIPHIHVQATNVELTNHYKSLISRRLTPIARLVRDSSDVDIAVMVRQSETPEEGQIFFVSIKVMAGEDTHMAVAAKPQLGGALSAVREMIRRSMSRGASVPTQSTHSMLKEYVDSYTLTI